MNNNTPFPIRKSPRLKNFDYSERNSYFVTICTHQKKCIFGEPEKCNWMGDIAREEMEKLENHYEQVKVDVFVVMPNHIHAIVMIEKDKEVTLNQIVGLYKSGVSRRIKSIYPEMTVWQRSYHDHVIRNQVSYEKIWNYVKYNAQKWEDDCFHPNHAKL